MTMTGPELLLDLAPSAADGRRPLRERLEDALRNAIRQGRLRPGDRLPATRTLASELGCSRWVVVEAYDQLAAEGWLEGRPGSGPLGGARAGVYEPPPGLRAPPAGARYAFTTGVPDLVAFPRTAWLRAMQHA